VAQVATLLEGFRSQRAPIVHIQTRTRPDGSDRMPHWREQQVTACVDGTPGADAPAPLRPAPDELVVTKQHYRGFTDRVVVPWLRQRSIARVVVCGLYTHACVRETVLDAYEAGFEVWVAADAVATTDPLHGEITRAWLEPRAARFRPSATVIAELAGPATGLPEGATA
jgi:nicotinamidase-related amidase